MTRHINSNVRTSGSNYDGEEYLHPIVYQYVKLISFYKYFSNLVYLQKNL